MRDVPDFPGLLRRLQPERALVAEPPREGAEQDAVRGLAEEALRTHTIDGTPLQTLLRALLVCCFLAGSMLLAIEQVGNLHFKATEYQVVKLFQEHGKIKREQFMYHRGGAKKGEPRGVMYVEYETEEEAAAGKSPTSCCLCANFLPPLQIA